MSLSLKPCMPSLPPGSCLQTPSHLNQGLGRKGFLVTRACPSIPIVTTSTSDVHRLGEREQRASLDEGKAAASETQMQSAEFSALDTASRVERGGGHVENALRT